MEHQKKQKKEQSFLASTSEFVILLLIVFLIRTFGFGLYQVPTGSMEHTLLIGERFFADKLSYVFRSPRHGEIISMNAPDFNYSEKPLINMFQRYVWGPSNWTKRVIGVPGDTIKGVIENGKPVIYRNGQKLDEWYINQYPLIRVLREDMAHVRAHVESTLQGIHQGRILDHSTIDRYIKQYARSKATYLSYDPAVSFTDQPFYRIQEDRVVRDDLGNAELLMPGMAVPSRDNKMAVEGNRNYWDGSDVFQVTLAEDQYWCMGDNRLYSKDSRFFGPFNGYQIHGRIIFRIWSIDSDESWWIVDLVKHPVDFWKRIRWNRFFQTV